MTKISTRYSLVPRTRDSMQKLFLAFVLIGPLACGKKDANEGAASTTQTVANAPMSGDAPQAKAGMSDDDALRGYTLTMRKVDAFAAASKAAAAATRGLPADQAAALRQSSSESGSTRSIDDMANSYDHVPPIRDAIKNAGLSSREYALIMFTTMQAMSMEAMTQANPKATLPANMNPVNLEFARANHDAIMRAMESVGSGH